MAGQYNSNGVRVDRNRPVIGEGEIMDLTSLTDSELLTLSDDVSFERLRRTRITQIDSLLETGLVDEGLTQGDPWRQPTGAHDAYPLGWIVSHNGKQWESTVAGNVWEPGVSGWREHTSDEWPEWVQPTGAHDSYALGAKVSHNDARWVSNISANVWEPGVSGWTESI